MTKNSMLMQTPYFSVVEGFRQFVRDSVRTEKDHYRWVNLYGEKGLDDPNPKVVEIQDEKAEQLAVACATLAYLTLSVYYGRNKFADTTFAELEGEDYSKFLRQAHYEMTDEHGQFGIFGWDGLITQIAKDCMPDKYVGDNKKASLVYTNMYWSVYNAMKSLKDGKSIRRNDSAPRTYKSFEDVVKEILGDDYDENWYPEEEREKDRRNLAIASYKCCKEYERIIKSEVQV